MIKPTKICEACGSGVYYDELGEVETVPKLQRVIYDMLIAAEQAGLKMYERPNGELHFVDVRNVRGIVNTRINGGDVE